MLVILFWFAAVGALSIYFIYPFILRFLTRSPGAEMPHVPASHLPPGSLIPAAHNEAHCSRDNIGSRPALGYPDLEIIVTFHAYSDETDQPDVVGYHHDGADASKEYQRKIRTIIDFLKGRRMTVWTPSKR